MSTYTPKDSDAWKLFTMVSFGVATTMMAGGIYFLDANFAAKGFYSMAAIMLVHTSVTITQAMMASRNSVSRPSRGRLRRCLSMVSSSRLSTGPGLQGSGACAPRRGWV